MNKIANAKSNIVYKILLILSIVLLTIEFFHIFLRSFIYFGNSIYYIKIYGLNYFSFIITIGIPILLLLCLLKDSNQKSKLFMFILIILISLLCLLSIITSFQYGLGSLEILMILNRLGLLGCLGYSLYCDRRCFEKKAKIFKIIGISILLALESIDLLISIFNYIRLFGIYGISNANILIAILSSLYASAGIIIPLIICILFIKNDNFDSLINDKINNYINKLNPEKALRFLNEKHKSGEVSDEEYAEIRADIISKL